MAIPPIKVIITGVDRFTAQMGKSMKTIQKMGKGMQNVGRQMTMGLTAPIVGAGVAIARVATGFEASMNKVEALTQAAGKPLQDMRELAKKLGRETQFTAGQAADAMAFLGMAGFETNDILAATPGLLDLAAASNTDLARSADIVSNMLGRFQLEAGEAGRVADILAATTASANVDMEMLEETMKAAGPIAKKAGASLKDTAVLAGFLGNMGIQGSLGGTAMKNMFVRLASPAGAAAGVLKKLGLEVADAQGNLRPYADIIGELSGKMAKLGTAQQLRVIDVLFGKRAIAAVGAMTGDMAKMNSGFARLSERLKETDGRAKQMATTMMKGAPGAFKRFISALEGMAIAIAESGFLDMLANAAVKFANLFKRIAELNPKILKWGMIVAGVVAAIGPLLFILGKLFVIFGAIGVKIAASGGIIAMLSNPIGWIIAAIVALIAILKMAGLKWKEIWRLMMIPLTPFVAIVEWIIERWKRILPFFKLLFMALGYVFKKFVGFIKPVLSPFLWLLDKIIGAIKKVLDFGLKIAEKVVSKIIPKHILEKAGFGPEVLGAGKEATPAPVGAEELAARAGAVGGVPGAVMNLKVEDRAGVKLTADVEKGDVETEVHRGLAFGF
jgi:TP901 family phage tail tape measure protein